MPNFPVINQAFQVSLKICWGVLWPLGGLKFGYSHYIGYWLLQQLALPYKPWRSKCSVMQPYLFISTTKFCAEADKETNNVDVTHVCSPVHCTAILLVKRVNSCTFLQQQLHHLHAAMYSVHQQKQNTYSNIKQTCTKQFTLVAGQIQSYAPLFGPKQHTVLAIIHANLDLAVDPQFSSSDLWTDPFGIARNKIQHWACKQQ